MPIDHKNITAEIDLGNKQKKRKVKNLKTTATARGQWSQRGRDDDAGQHFVVVDYTRE